MDILNICNMRRSGPVSIVGALKNGKMIWWSMRKARTALSTNIDDLFQCPYCIDYEHAFKILGNDSAEPRYLKSSDRFPKSKQDHRIPIAECLCRNGYVEYIYIAAVCKHP